ATKYFFRTIKIIVNMNKLIILTLLIISTLSSLSQTYTTKSKDSLNRVIKHLPEKSFINILSEKEKYNGKCVRVTGYLSWNGRLECYLFYLKEFAEISSYDNSIYFDLPGDFELIEQLRIKNNNYVSIVGVIRFDKNGPLGICLASFDEIFSIGPVL
nr:hypothetical protein [Chitinophagaceae bacterium]